MKPARFAYLAPGSVDEATAILGEHGDEARLLAGGQSLGPLLNLRLAQPPIVVDVNRLSSLDYIRVEDDGSLSVGALTRQRRAETSPVVARAWPLLTEAIGEIGHRAIRNRGTIGGSIAHADPAAELPACLVALGATCRLASSAATRDVAAADFFRGPFSTVLRTGEMLVGITVPGPRPAGTQAWLEFSRRHGDFGLVGVATIVNWARDGSIADLELAYSGAHWTPWQPPDEVAAHACGERPGRALFELVGAAAAAASSPPEDLHASTQHRRRLIATLTARALARCASRAAATGVRG